MHCVYVSSRLKKSYLDNININIDEWKCNLILEMIDCMYGLCQ